MPFVMGLEQDMLQSAYEYFQENENIYLVYIEEQRIDISNNINISKKSKKKTNIKDFGLPSYPKDNYDQLQKELAVIHQNKNKKNVNLSFIRII